jgi:hypothetical protein
MMTLPSPSAASDITSIAGTFFVKLGASQSTGRRSTAA